MTIILGDGLLALEGRTGRKKIYMNFEIFSLLLLFVILCRLYFNIGEKEKGRAVFIVYQSQNQ